MNLDVERVRENAARSSTEDLICRVTVFRAGMEPEALVVIEDELERRGVSRDELDRRWRELSASALRDAQGQPLRCAHCDRPAIARRREWWRLLRLIPLFPWDAPVCAAHSPGEQSPSAPAE
jgi:tRNA 2-selenouridine synthase SelU